MAELLTVPYLGTAEDEVVLVDWLVAEGEAFRKGQPLLVLETLKASFEVEAETDGVLLRQLEPAGRRVSIQAALGVWGDAREIDEAQIASLLEEHASQPEPAADAAPASEPDAPPRQAATEQPVAPAARRRAAELGVDLGSVAGTGKDGLVRVEDVETAAEAQAQAPEGMVDPMFLEHVRADPEAFGRLTTQFKLALYRKHGAAIGEGASFGSGTVILADRLVLGAGVRFGEACTVEAHEFMAGRLVQFGARCRVRCRRVQIGDNAFFAPDVEIGGGGAMDPEAELVVGSHGFVGEHAHLNPCRKLVIGDEVVVSRAAVIMTHSFGGSVLRGAPNRFARVEIGNACQIGIGAVLFPGVTMEEGAILLSGSSLVTGVPAGRLYGGVPAKDLKASTRDLEPEELEGVARDLVDEFARQLELRGMNPQVRARRTNRELLVERDGKRHRLFFGRALATDQQELLAEDIRVCLRAEDGPWRALAPEIVGIDLGQARIRGPLGPMAAAFREFLRKRGVRLEPRTWTYRGGWL